MAKAKAKAEAIVHKRIELDLSEQEALYIQAILQNHPLGYKPEEEPVSNRKHRESIWTALNDSLKG